MARPRSARPAMAFMRGASLLGTVYRQLRSTKAKRWLNGASL
ncbi:protein of unknown function (plasmid) [Caballeronia sp. S22]